MFQENTTISDALYAQIELPAFALEKPQRELNVDIHRGNRLTFVHLCSSKISYFFKPFCQFSMWLEVLCHKVLLSEFFHS